jgi:hypothetical protein
MSALYTALAILGLIAAGLVLFGIAWAVLNFDSFVDFAAQLFENEDGEIADAWGDVPALREEMRAGGQNLIPAGGVADTEHDRPSLTRNTHIFLSGPLSGTGPL